MTDDTKQYLWFYIAMLTVAAIENVQILSDFDTFCFWLRDFKDTITTIKVGSILELS